MPSTFTWLDYSEHERRKMLDVIDQFGEKTTRDELGLGGVRDAFANMLFPGTSTIQTVAKYFLLVPWIYQSLERRKTPSSKLPMRARKAEIALARALEDSGESNGVIGRIAKEKLQRLPSSVYWQGLLEWGIRTFPGSQAEYHRTIDLFYKRQQGKQAGRDEHEGESAKEAEFHNWHPGLPEPDSEFPTGAKLRLSVDEASYLRERLMTHCSQSLMAFIVRERVNVNGVDHAWDLGVELPDHLRIPLDHGRNFSEVMHGSQLLYNLILAEKREWKERREDYEALLSEWAALIEDRMGSLRVWNRKEFWKIVYKSNPRVSGRARSFIRSWIELIVGENDLVGLVNNATARRLVEHREIQLKGSLARVRSARARDLWNGAAGAAQLDLRWGSAKRIVADILAGLDGVQDA